VSAVKALTEDGLGPDSVVEAAGNPATWQQALAMVRRGGVVNFFSGLPSGTRVEIDPAAIHYSEIKLISPFHHTPRFFREALEAIRRGDISARDFRDRRNPAGRPTAGVCAHEVPQRRDQVGRSAVVFRCKPNPSSFVVFASRMVRPDRAKCAICAPEGLRSAHSVLWAVLRNEDSLI